MKRYTERALRNYIRSHSKWGPAKREDRLRFFALALCGEAGELANFVKKEWRGDLKGKGRTAKLVWESKCVSEAADVGAYAMMYLDLLTGGHLGEEVFKKFMEVEERALYQAALRKRVAKVKRNNPFAHGTTRSMLAGVRMRSPALRPAIIDGPTWKAVVRKWVNAFPGEEFSLKRLYADGDMLAAGHPDNRHVKFKLQQVVQELRDEGRLQFLTNPKGRYKILRRT